MVNIQRRWRGYHTRSRFRIYVENDEEEDCKKDTSFESPSNNNSRSSISTRRRKLLEPPRTPPKSISTIKDPSDALPSITTKRKPERVPYHKDFEVEFIVEEASGLPLTTTATRIHTKLYMPTDMEIRDISPFTYCDIESKHTQPRFNHYVKWKGTFPYFISYIYLILLLIT